MKRLALALLLLAAPAEARRIYVSPVGNDSSTTYLTSGGTPLRTLDKAINSKATTGDSIMLAHSAGVHSSGRYADGILPNVYWKVLQSITIIGDSSKPNAVVVPSVSISANSANRRFGDWALVGVRVNGNFDCQENNGVENADADGLILRHVTIQRHFSLSDVDANLYNVRAGIHPDTASSRTSIRSSEQDANIVADRFYVYAQPSSATDYTDPAIELRTITTANYWLKLTVTNSLFRVYAPNAWAPPKPTFFSGWNDCSISDSKFEIVDSTGTDTLRQGGLWRDNLERNVMLRDTFITRTVRAGEGGGVFRLTSPGSNDLSHNVGGGNTWRYCWFQSNVPTIDGTGGTIGFDWQIQPGDSFYYNVAVCSTGTTRAGFNVNNILGAAYIGNNTFYNRGTGGAFMVNDDGENCGYMNGKLKVENNIFYSQSTGQTASDYAAAMKWPAINRVTDVIDSDYNLFAHYGNANGGRSLSIAPCGSNLALFKPDSARAVYGIETNSRHGSPRFVDSSFANFNPNLLSTSAAISAGRNGVTIGAREYVNPRPESVSDLTTLAAAPNAVVLAWTATGEDSLTGTAASYIVRYSLTYISDFDLATDVSGEPTPGVAGTMETFTVSGLTAGTPYYFAVKVVDGAGQVSEISNVTMRVTTSGGPGFADP